MKLAFCLYKYFPYGGLQRDFLRIALECQRKGHDIRVYTLAWRGEIPDGFEVVIVPVEAFTNHTRYERYHRWVKEAIARNPVDGVVGINKMPGLDVYYAADSCYEEKAQTQRGFLYRLLPRYKHFARFERAVFSKDSDTEIMMISEAQQPYFEKYYGTQDERLHYLPPGIGRDRVAPPDAEKIRTAKREELGIDGDQHLLLMVGSGFVKKGLRRALLALRSLPHKIRSKTHFFVIGEDNPAPFKRLVFTLGLRENVTILSGREDVPEFLLAADLLLHPALDENAGIVLLEAIVSGLPVLATDICGYGHYVETADVGELLPSPFDQDDLNSRLQYMIESDRRDEWRRNGGRFAAEADIFSLPEHASDLIEDAIRARMDARQATPTLALCLFKYFPYGGLQRDFLKIASEFLERGFNLRIYTLEWQGPIPDGFEVIIVPVNAITNHSRYRLFADWVLEHMRDQPVDAVVGFNKMPGLDFYYAADSCYEEKAQKQRGRLYRSIPRYTLFSEFERAVFDRDVDTEIMMISEVQKPVFLKYYDTPLDRFHMLPPGISPDRKAPPDSDVIRKDLRAEMGIADGETLLLMVGSGFITKGLDRILNGMASLPSEVKRKCRLIAIGQDAPGAFQRMAQRLGLGSRVKILRGRDDVSRFMLGADLLLHPAYTENTGTVILEAIVSGLPVLTTDVCGYAHFVEEADAGRVVPSPFRQENFNGMLADMIASDEKSLWQANGLKFAEHADIYSMPQRAVDFIESKLRPGRLQ